MFTEHQLRNMTAEEIERFVNSASDLQVPVPITVVRQIVERLSGIDGTEVECLQAELTEANDDNAALESEVSDLEDEIEQLRHELDAATKLCEIYFNIARDFYSEDEIRRRRDAAIPTAEEKP